MRQIIDVAVGVVTATTQAGQRILIARRPSAGVLGGYWEFPGGKCEQGESLEQCLVREMREELDIDIAVAEALSPIEHRYEHGHVRLHPFICTHQAREPKAVAVSEFCWIRPEQLGDYAFPPANEALLREVRERFVVKDHV